MRVERYRQNIGVTTEDIGFVGFGEGVENLDLNERDRDQREVLSVVDVLYTCST